MNARSRTTGASRAPRWAAAVALTLAASLAATACGSDEPSSDDDTEDVADSTPTDAEPSAAVDAFCDSTDALITQIGTVAAAGDLSSLSGAVSGINESGAAIVEAEPAAAPAVAACMQAVSTALAAAANGATPGDDAPDSTDPTDAPDSPDGPTSDNPDVEAFCTTAEEVADELAKVMADPTSGDVAAITAKAQEMAAQATTLMTANPADAAAVTACLQAVTDALTPGGPGVPPTTPGEPGGTASAAVEQFCADAEALGQQLKDAMTNPAGADVAAITAKAQELTTQIATLTSANPADAARISECALKLNPTG